MADAQRRDYVIDQAIRARKFTSERAAHWRGLYDSDPAGTEQVLASLASVSADASPYPRELFPELARAGRLATASAPTTPPPSVGGTEPTPDLVGAWSRQLFPETAAGGGPSRVTPGRRIMEDVLKVALLALTYRECWRQGYRDYDDVLEDFEQVPDRLSLVTVISAEQLTQFDWDLMNLLSIRNGRGSARDFNTLAHILAEFDPLRAEALLHACPPNGLKSRCQWAAPLVWRWEEVGNAMDAFREEGLATNFEDVGLIARQACLNGGLDPADYGLFEETVIVGIS